MDVSTRSTFRLVLVLYAVLSAVLIAMAFLFGKGQLPDAALAYLRWWAEQPRSSLQSVLAWIGLTATVVSVLCAIAMTVFARWARPLFAVCVVVLVASEAQYGYPVLQTSIGYLFSSVLAVLAGGIIVFSYWSGVSDAFAKQAT
jgi:hypothetical protein